VGPEGFEPAISCSRGTRNTRLSYVLNLKSAQRELNPRLLHGKQVRYHYAMSACRTTKLSKIQEHREGLEPSSPHYESGIFAARRPVLVPVRNLEREAQFERPFKPSSRRPSSAEVGPVGIEPTSSGLRDRCITLSATVPNQSARWESNPRLASYKDAALTTELRASSASRAGGI
jgi:hypothetical protein